MTKAAVLTTGAEATSPLFDLATYSDYNRALRVTSWLRRFTKNCRRSVRTTGPPTAIEIAESETFWVKHTQKEVFPEEIQALTKNRRISETSRIAQLNPFLDEGGVMRLEGRLQCSDNCEDIKHPIILPKCHALARLIIMNTHRRMLHGGVQTTMSALRERWWLLQARQAVKSVIHRCAVCVKFRARPASAPTAPLPATRTDPTHPFDTTGVDFAGPLYVKTTTNTASPKCYVVLFTCATTRAVHLELATDLTARAFVMAFRRFLSRRGVPSTIYSDNALAFKKAARDIRELWKAMCSTEFQDFVSTKRIHWQFIVERAAWWGGMWERMVRTVKNCLRRSLGRQSLTFEELETLLSEVEAVVNSRPLTFLHSSPEEPIALTPAHLLIGKTLTALPEQPAAPVKPSTASTAVKRWRHRQQIADRFWKRWKHEYLLELRSAHLCRAQRNQRAIGEGDVVLLHEDKAPRSMWKLVKVTELYRGRDGNVRACQVRLPSGTVTRRPVQLLYPLELDCN
ncbi:uncharacterized protein LOC135389183 [Ornithodoros turicata]|uniref:uncharacterized protein LOC135389183 n=1 Tax=Ornithodoros turicata TaxID=34597 RepID=UPI003138ACD5